MQKEIPIDFPDFCLSDDDDDGEFVSLSSSPPAVGDVVAPSPSAVTSSKKDRKKRLYEVPSINSSFLRRDTVAEDPNVDFRFKTRSGIGFKNFIDICRKINSELEMVLFEKGIACVVSGISSKHLIQTVFRREHFFEYYIRDDVMSINLDVNDMFGFIKKITKNESFEMVKMKNDDFASVNILNMDEIMHIYPRVPISNYISSISPDYNNTLYFPFKGALIATKSATVRVYKFTAESHNAKLGIEDKDDGAAAAAGSAGGDGGDAAAYYGYEKTSAAMDSLFFYKVIFFLVKNKIGKICFRIFSSGTIEIEGMTQASQTSSQKIVIYGNKCKGGGDGEKIVEVVLPLNLLILILKFVAIQGLNGILKIIPVNSKCFAIESTIFENVISRFYLKGKLNK